MYPELAELDFPNVFHLHIDRARLRSRRYRLGWTMTFVARITGLSRKTIAAIERGDSIPTVLSLALLCHIYDLPLAEVVTIQELPF